MLFFKQKIPKLVSCNEYYLTYDSLSADQRSFYNYLVKELQKGNYIEIGSNLSYIYAYIYSCFDKLKKDLSNIKEVTEKVLSVHRIYGNKVIFRSWIGDLYLLDKNLEKALEYYQADLDPSRIQTHSADHILNLKFHNKIPVGTTELLCSYKKVTSFGSKHFQKIVKYSEIVISKENEILEQDFLQYLGKKYKKDRIYNYSFLAGYPGNFYINQPPIRRLANVNYKTYSFYAIDEFRKFCENLTRSAENMLREDLDMPRVGEGWVSETELYYKIKNFLPDLDVIQHASPKWLGRQHLDVYIPKLKLAFEYQGDQHTKPIDFFGGEEAFKKTVSRDKKKKRKCELNGVELIEVFKNYDFKDIEIIILSHIS